MLSEPFGLSAGIEYNCRHYIEENTLWDFRIEALSFGVLASLYTPAHFLALSVLRNLTLIKSGTIYQTACS